jgi:hypothetical protein
MSDDDDERAERYEELLGEVKQNGGVLNVDMGRLRDVHGAGKLGNIVVQAISEELDGQGLSHTPKELPTLQWKQVIIYRNGTPVSRLINAILNVEEGSSDVIRQFTTKNDDAATIKKIRELVCD